MGEAKEVEGLRFPAEPCATSRWTPEAHQPRFLGIDLQPEAGESLGDHPLDFLNILQPLEAHDESSSPGELHPQALAEPDLNLSTHPAPMTQPPVEPPRPSAQTDLDSDAHLDACESWRGAPFLPITAKNAELSGILA